MARPSAYACFRFGGRRYPCGTRTHWTNTPSESASSCSASAVLAEAPDCSTMMGSQGAWRVSLPLALAFFLALACALSLPLSDSTSPTFSGLLPWVSLAGLEAEAVSEPASEPGALNKA